MAAFEGTNYKKITLSEMMKYIEENAPEDKKWFKGVAYQNKKGEKLDSYNHLNAVREFCKKYAEHLLPEKRTRTKADDAFKDW